MQRAATFESFVIFQQQQAPILSGITMTHFYRVSQVVMPGRPALTGNTTHTATLTNPGWMAR
ncbi:hypothetical protein OK016_19360 [Vibrio chagasii]|nr:hypothetical protein [Vibrio chagasii]